MYQNILTTDDIDLCLTDTSAKRLNWHPLGDNTYQYEECVCPPVLCLTKLTI